MRDSESNLKFEYLYRDAGNYKQFGRIVLQNPTKISPEIAKKTILPHLIDGEFFYPDKIQVPRLEIHDFDFELDHDWYEFEKFSLTDEKPTESVNAHDFLYRFA